MHDTAKAIGGRFFEIYARPGVTVIELGAFDVNGSLREVCRPDVHYVGIDISAGPGVDLVVKPGAALPVASDAADIVVASSMFEHDLFFWETFLEMARIAKAGGVIYISAPSNGIYHRYPVDNWRFYPDSGKVLAAWAIKHGFDVHLVESFLAERKADIWNDFVAVFAKAPLPATPAFLSDAIPATNSWRLGIDKIHLERELPEDMVLLRALRAQVESLRADVARREGELAEARLKSKRLLSRMIALQRRF